MSGGTAGWVCVVEVLLPFGSKGSQPIVLLVLRRERVGRTARKTIPRGFLSENPQNRFIPNMLFRMRGMRHGMTLNSTFVVVSFSREAPE